MSLNVVNFCIPILGVPIFRDRVMCRIYDTQGVSTAWAFFFLSSRVSPYRERCLFLLVSWVVVFVRRLIVRAGANNEHGGLDTFFF